MKISDDFSQRQEAFAFPLDNRDSNQDYYDVNEDGEDYDDEVNIESLKINGTQEGGQETRVSADTENEVIFNLTQSQNQIGDDIRAGREAMEEDNRGAKEAGKVVAQSMNLKTEKQNLSNSPGQKRELVQSSVDVKKIKEAVLKESQSQESKIWNVNFNILKAVFDLLDGDNDGKIDADTIELDGISISVLEALEPLILEVYQSPDPMNFNQFLQIIMDQKISENLIQVSKKYI